MSYLKHITSYINSELDKNLLNDACFANKRVISIAEALPRMRGETMEIFPSYIDEDGEAQYVGPDDEFDLIIYHKVNSIGVGKAAIKNNSGFGDDKGYDANVAAMSMIVFGMRDKLKLSNDELAIYLQASFPEAATKDLLRQLQFAAANINIKEINLDSVQVFIEEFKQIPFFLKPEQFLFKLNYNIESAFLKRCFKKCNC